MMTIHRLHAGDGYEYLTSQVACGDRERGRQDLVDYYAEHGTPPGQWFGRGAELLGVSGPVTEAQMRALYGEGLHPDADRIIADAIAAGDTAREAIARAKLGSEFAEYTTKKTPIMTLLAAKIEQFTIDNQRRPDTTERGTLRTDAAREHLTAEPGRRPTRSEISDALADEKRLTKQAVAGFDTVFTPQKSISLLWGLGDDEIRRIIWECHQEAVHETLRWAEDHYAVTRRGKAGVRQIDADGLTIATFQHYDNRTGDPNPHTHAVISAKVRGSDGKWSALDARPLYAGGVALSTRYNATVTGKVCRRLGLQTEERSRGRGKEPVLEIAGVDQQMIDTFSRRPNIIARTEELIADYRDIHGRNPSKATQIKLAQQATLETRDEKPVPRSLRELVTEWNDRAAHYLSDGRDGETFIRDLIHDHNHPDRPRPSDPHDIAMRVGVDAGGSPGLAGRSPTAIDHLIDTELRNGRWTYTDEQHFQRDRGRVVELLGDRSEGGFLSRVDADIAARQRKVYDPDRIVGEVADTVARRRATWTEANIRSAVEERVGVCTFDTDSAHRAAVEDIFTQVRERSIRLTVDPDPVPAAIQRRNGESEFTVTGAVRYTSEGVLAAEARLQAAAVTPTVHFVAQAHIDRAIADAEHAAGRTLNDGQRAIARHMCSSGMQLAVAIGPAGTGKTTAMKAAADAWRADGRTVIALGPSAAAARVLGEEVGAPGQTIARILTLARHGHDTGITPGTMLLVDEAAMAATGDLDALQNLAAEHDAVIRWIGDPYQLSAVESGGAMRLIARDTKAPELFDVVRFTDPDEAAASLAVREGNPDGAWEFYDNHDRVRSGMAAELREEILAAHLADLHAGRSSLMLAATTADVAALNSAAQAALAAAGHVMTSQGAVTLADHHNGHVGDVIVTRQNNSRLRVTGGRRNGNAIANGDLWTIKKIHTDGSVTAIGNTHRGTVVLPPNYVRDNVELGYASTIHRSQGMTVKRSYVLMGAHLGHALAYVGLTRGSDTNTMYLETDSVPDLALDHPPDEPLTPYATFCRVLARDDDNLTATEVMRAEQAHIDDPQRIRGVYDHITALLADTRGQWLLDHALPAYLYNSARQSDRFQTLLDTIARADALGLDSRALVTAIATNHDADLGESLATARDTAAVLRARAELWIAAHDTTAPVDEVTPPPVPSRHPGMDVELADYAAELHARLVSRQIASATESPERDPATPVAPDRTPTPRSYRDIPGTTVTYAPFIQASVDTPMPDLATTYQQLADSLRGELADPAAGAPIWITAPPTGDSWDHLLVAQHYAIITERTRRLGELAADEQPDWTAHLGPRPTRPIAQARWDDLAGHIAAYREQFGIDDNASLIGPQPNPDDPHAGAWEQLTQQTDRLRAQHAQTTQRSTPETDRDLDRAREEEERRQRMGRHTQRGGPDRSIGPEL